MSKLLTKKNSEFMKFAGLTVGKIVLLSFLALLAVILLIVYLFLNFYKPNIQLSGEDEYWNELDIDFALDSEAVDPDYQLFLEQYGDLIDSANASKENDGDTAAPAEQRKDCYTFLLVGIDRGGLNTDTMMIVTFDAKENKISIGQLPRDTYINNSYSLHKLNAVVPYGYSAAIRAGKTRDEALKAGIKALEDTIKKTFGVPINRHIVIDLAGFKTLVDELGGVEVNVPENMYYSDPYQDLYINLKKGTQILDGNKAEQFVRYRSYNNADLGRLDAQKMLITAIMKKMTDISLSKVQKLLGVAEKYVTTNLSATDMAYFVKEALQVKPENIRMHTMPGEGLYVGKAAYYSLYEAETMEIINKYYNPYEEAINANRFDILEFSRKEAYLVNIDGKTMAD